MNNYDIGKQEAKLRLDRLGQCANDEVLVNDRRTKKGWYCRKGVDLKNPVQPATERPPEVVKKKSNTGLIVGTGIVGTALLGGALILGSKGSGDTPPKTTVKAENPKEKELQAKATELAQKEAQLAQNQKRNQDWETELNQRSQELEKKQGDLDGFTKANQGKEKELKNLSQELTKQKTDLDQVVKKNQEKETEIEQRSQQLSQQEEVVNKRSQELVQMQSDIEKQAKLNLETKKSLDQRSSLLDKKEQELNQREQTLSRKEQEILGREQAIEQKEKAQEELNSKPKWTEEEQQEIDKGRQLDLREPLSEEEQNEFMAQIFRTDFDYNDPRKHLRVSERIFNERSKKTTKAKELMDTYGLNEAELASLLSYTSYGYIGTNELLRGRIKPDTPVGKLSSLLARQFNQAIEKLPLYQDTDIYRQRLASHLASPNGKDDYFPIERSALVASKKLEQWEVGETIKMEGFVSSSPSGYSDTVGKEYRELNQPRREGESSLTDTVKFPLPPTKLKNRNNFMASFGLKILPDEQPTIFKIKDIKTGRYIDPLLSSTYDDKGEIIFPTNTPFQILHKEFRNGVWEIHLSEINYELDILSRMKKKDSLRSLEDIESTDDLTYLPHEIYEWRLTDSLNPITTWRPSWSS